MAQTAYLHKLTKKLFLIYSLNAVDWICTVILLSTGDFIEANPLARLFIDNLPLGFFIKCMLPLGIILGVIALIRVLSVTEMFTADRWISFLLVFYLFINIDHVINFIILHRI